jgi:hypothetical protein
MRVTAFGDASKDKKLYVAGASTATRNCLAAQNGAGAPSAARPATDTFIT